MMNRPDKTVNTRFGLTELHSVLNIPLFEADDSLLLGFPMANFEGLFLSF